MLYRPLTSLALILSLSLAACSTEDAPPTGNVEATAAAPYTVEEVPLSQISEDLASGKTTSVAITQAYIDRIDTYDDALNSVILIAPDALEQAAASDQRRKEGQALGPLDGVPILLKDNIDAMGMPTTAGSFALEANIPAQDSEVVERLRAAGAVILGKANTSQWAGFRNTVAFNGSTVGGSPKNPHDLTRSPAGSSSGSGAAAAASFAAGTIGTDTGGSITGPANANGVVGLRPTIALVSRQGIVPISLTQDTAGPLVRTVRDAAMLLNIIAGSDPNDPWSKDADANKRDYVQALSADALKGKRIGVLREIRSNSEENKALFEEALKTLQAQGAELVDIPPSIFEDLLPEMRVILLHDFKEDVNAYLAGTPDTVKTRTLADLIEFNKTDPRESMHTQDLFIDSEATKGGRKNPTYMKTLQYAKRKAGPEGIDRALKEHNVVALVIPSGNPAEVIPPDGTDRFHPVENLKKGQTPPSATTYAAVAGYPHLSVPMGTANGMPVGLSFIGTAWSEAELLALGYAYEQASQKRVPPQAYKETSASAAPAAASTAN